MTLEIPVGIGTGNAYNASYPYLVQANYRAGYFTHYAGAGTVRSAKLSCNGEEVDLCRRWVDSFPEPQRGEWTGLLAEMEALKTREARLYKALDKIEAIISHNESDIHTWLPLEYDLQLTYGLDNMTFSEYMMKLRALVDDWTREKIEREG